MKDYAALEKLLSETGGQIERMLAIRGCTREADLVYELTDLYATLILQYFVAKDNGNVVPAKFVDQTEEHFKKIETMY